MEESVAPPNEKFSWGRTFAALKHRNYRLWFWGQMVSLFGTWMQSTAQGFLIFQLTNSPAYLGYVGFAAGVPTWFLTAYGGVIADRLPRQKLILMTQTAMMAQAVILATLTFLGVVQPWHIVVLAFGLGIANAFDAPARLAFISEMVERDDLTNAIALNATMFNSATAIGPAAAGITYAAFGPAWCFTLNALSFTAVITALLMMRVQNRPATTREASDKGDLKTGIMYVVNDPNIRTLFSLVALISLFGVSLGVLIPAWAVRILHGDATTNGLLQSARGVGALIAALLIASLGRFTFKGKLLSIGTFLFPLFLLAFALMRLLPFSLIMIACIGVSTILVLNLSHALVQMLVPDSLRGRVMGVYSLTFFGLMPIGALFMGWMAELIDEPWTVALAASISLTVALSVWKLSPKLRELK
ncbi:MAG: MFS transporter [Ignavibacteriales bacterium]|nr:MFS transporter [Ignavibacteriales bacterium]